MLVWLFIFELFFLEDSQKVKELGKKFQNTDDSKLEPKKSQRKFAMVFKKLNFVISTYTEEILSLILF